VLERPSRLFFSATTISTFGDAVEHIALAFAVLAMPGGAFAIALVCLVATALVRSVRAIRAADEELVATT